MKRGAVWQNCNTDTTESSVRISETYLKHDSRRQPHNTNCRMYEKLN